MHNTLTTKALIDDLLDFSHQIYGNERPKEDPATTEALKMRPLRIATSAFIAEVIAAAELMLWHRNMGERLESDYGAIPPPIMQRALRELAEAQTRINAAERRCPVHLGNN